MMTLTPAGWGARATPKRHAAALTGKDPMHEEYFGFSEKPFSLTPDPKYLYRSESHGDAFDVTQDFLAFMLGVRRVGVTAAARFLQSRALIRYSRGHVTVLDRMGLEAAACTCYRSDLDIYRDVLDAHATPRW